MTDTTRQRLLEAAEQIFAEKGFKAASVRKICELADANPAAVSFYFRGKQALYNEAVKHAYQCCTEGEPFPDWPAGTAPAVKLRDFIRVMVARMMQPHSPSSLQLMMREMAQPTAAGVNVVRDYIRPIADRLRGIMAELLPQASESKRILTAFSIVGQCLFYRHQRAVAELLIGPEEFAKLDAGLVTDHITAFSLAALELASPRARPGRKKSKARS
jgi:AcrR family transcriptional regulator